MDDDKEFKEALEQTAVMAHSITEDHNHGCPVGQVARIVRDACIDARESLAAGSGPAQVATDDYRRNWDTIFGAKQSWGQA
jgi:hypothetical protein